VADSFHWPDDSEVEALDLERGVIARGTPPSPGGQNGKAVAFPTRPAAPVSVDDESGDSCASEDDEEAQPPLAQTSGEDRPALSPAQAPPPSSDVTGVIRRWALPLLAVIVVVETGWLAMDRIGGRTEPAPTRSAVPTAAAGGAPPSAVAVPPPSSIPAPTQATVTPGATAPAVLPPTPAVAEPVAVTPGNVSIPLPFQVQVYEGTRFIGINNGNLPLTPGTHQLQLVNDSLGLRTTERVVIASGRTTRLTAAVPSVRVQLNAVPWAEVSVDGTSVGETPLGNVTMSIGPHTLDFRHPQLGEQTRNVVITTQPATRISVDLRK
jgi:hypothetical protein